MDEIVKTDPDNSFSIDKSHTLVDKFKKILYIDEATRDVDFEGILNKVLQYIDISTTLQINPDTEYYLQIPLELREKMRSNELFMMKNQKTNVEWPFLIKIAEDGKNEIVTPLSVKEHFSTLDNSLRDFVMGYHNLYMQRQINELSEMMKKTLDTVNRIEAGQKDDRLGQLKAGRRQIYLAINQKDEEGRKNALLLGMQDVIIAQEQIFATFAHRVAAFGEISQYQIKVYIHEILREGYVQNKINEYNEIKDYYNLILQATEILAFSYLFSGDLENAKRVFDITIEEIKDVDFSRLKTFRYIDNNRQKRYIYNYAVDDLDSAKQKCLKNAEQDDYLSIRISGKKLLEAINGKSPRISE